MKTYELIPLNGRVSFYGKCRVEDDGEIATLISYTTKVATYNHETKTVTVFDWYSANTARHINAFLHHFGFPTIGKKEMIQGYEMQLPIVKLS